MKVCHIVQNFLTQLSPPYEYTRKLAAAGVSVDVFAFRHPNEPEEEIIEGVNVHRVITQDHSVFTARTAFRFIPAVLRALEGRRYDIAHVHAFRGCSLLRMLAGPYARIWMMNIRSGNVTSGRYKAKILDRVTGIESLVFDEVLVHTAEIARRILIPGRAFHLLPCGADFEKFVPGNNQELRSKLKIPPEAPVVGFSSSLTSLRNPQQVIRAFALATTHRPDLNLLVIGDGPMLSELRKLAEELGVSTRTHFTGYVPYGEVHKAVVTANIGLAYVHRIPQYEYQPPLKTVEYLACGLPTIATRTHGNAAFIQDGVNGLLVDDNPQAIAEAILRLCSDTDLATALAARSRPSVVQYDWANIVTDKLIPVYQDVLSMAEQTKHGKSATIKSEES